MTTVIPAIHVYCPLCLAPPGQPCEQVVNDLITARPEPHDLRIRAAEEMARE